MDTGNGAHKLDSLRDVYLRDMDLRDALPRIPRLVPEVVAERFGRDRVLIYGAKDPVVFKTPRGEAALSELLGKVTSTRMEELLSGSPQGEDQRALFDLVVSLTRAGLLEDEADLLPSQGALASFLGRYAGAVASSANRTQALDRLSRSRIYCAVAGVEAPWVLQDLSASGFGYVVVERAGEIRPESIEGATHALFITNRDEDLRDIILRAHQLGITHLIVRIGANECQVGPFVLPGFTSGYECLTRTLEPPPGRASACDAQFWAGYAVHMVTTLVVQLVVPQLNQVQRIFSLPGAPRETVVIPMHPGSATSPVEHDETYETDPSLRKVWAHHMGLRRPPRAILSPLTHFNHFTPANIARTKLTPRRYYGRALLPLPHAPVSATAPWLTQARAESRALTLAGLASVLRAMAGYSDASGVVRRIAPTGGGLESPEAYLYVRDVDGLAQGGYRYFGPEHALEPLPHLDWELVTDSLGLAQQCAIINVAWFDKVRGKYGDFGYSIVHYDAGVAMACARLVCEVQGFEVGELGLDPPVISRGLDLIGLDNEYLPTSAIALGVPVAASRGSLPGALQDLIRTARTHRTARPGVSTPTPCSDDYAHLRSRSGQPPLEQVLLTRRSVNTFVDDTVPTAVIRELLRVATDSSEASQRTGAPEVTVTPLLLRRRGDDALPSGVHIWDAGRSAFITRRTGLSSQQLADCINQIGLSTASDIVVMLGSIPEAVNRYGEAGYRALLLRAGSMVAHMWLAAHAAGLSSTAAGGVLEPGIALHAGCDGYRECPMLSFAIGARRWLPA